MRLVFNCIFWYLLVIVHDQSGIKCGVGSQRKFAIFFGSQCGIRLLQQKLLYFNVSRKILYFSRQNKNYESPKILKVHYVECPIRGALK